MWTINMIINNETDFCLFCPMSIHIFCFHFCNEYNIVRHVSMLVNAKLTGDMPMSNASTIREWTDSYNRFNTQFTYEPEIPVDTFVIQLVLFLQ
jgi:hypothetical protein